MTKKAAAASPPETTAGGLTVREYIKQELQGRTLSSIAKAAKIPLSSLTMHLNHPTVELSLKNAKKLEKWSGGKISAARTVGL